MRVNARWRKDRPCARGRRRAGSRSAAIAAWCGRTPETAALSVTIADIEAARRVIAGAVLRTPMLPAPRLSALTGAEVFVKYENLQVTNSFKDRGALVKLASLSEAERKRGVIAMSAGNHAQAVAYHAARLGIPATIVMPVTTPFVKVAATRSHGAEVVLDGETVAEAQARCEQIQAERGLTLVHPYDDARIIAGQGTIALEMLEEVPDLDALVIPIGGGGLIAGNAIAARAIKPDDRDRRRRGRALSVGVERDHRRAPADRRADAGRRHRGQECRQADAAGDPRTGGRHRAGRRGAARARGQRLSHAAEDHGGRRRRRRPGRAAGRAGALPRQARRPDPVRRQYRSAHSRLDHGARTRARDPHRLVPPHHSRPAGRARHRSRRGSASSAPISWKSITAGCCSTCRPRAPSSTSPSRRATRAHAEEIMAALAADGYQPVRIEAGAAME